MTGYSAEEIAARGHPVWAEIDLGAIRHNIGELAAKAPRSEVMGVVKGYAYGHGNPASARAILQAGATRLGVARLAEALHLRDAGITAPIHVFTEPPHDAIPNMLASNITPTVYTERFADALSIAASTVGRRVGVHVKIDTGMHRVGLAPDDATDAFTHIASLPGVDIEGAWSHLAVADVPDHPFNRKQLDVFEDVTGKLVRAGIALPLRHLANSAAVLSFPDAHFDLVRCGVAAYGLWPGPALKGSADLRPAMSLRARINMVKEVAAGESLSYGLSYEVKKRSFVATVPIGYADGYDRGLSGLGDVLIKGVRHRVSGTVCMDQFMVDVGDAGIDVGATATLIGSQDDDCITAEELASHIGTINYEITSRIASRVPRLYVDEVDEPST
jgi:alanine racemase